MQEHDLIQNETDESPIVIQTSGVSAGAKELFESISKRAFEPFESQGNLSGRDLDHWLQAERELFQAEV